MKKPGALWLGFLFGFNSSSLTSFSKPGCLGTSLLGIICEGLFPFCFTMGSTASLKPGSPLERCERLHSAHIKAKKKKEGKKENKKTFPADFLPSQQTHQATRWAFSGSRKWLGDFFFDPEAKDCSEVQGANHKASHFTQGILRCLPTNI